MTESVPAEVVKAGERPPLPMTLPDVEAIEPTHFDGWSVGDLTKWLDEVGPSFGMIRRGIGLALWHLRQRLGTEEGVYARAAEALASSAGVSPRTVQRWRVAAEDYFHLAPTARSVEKRKSATDRVSIAPSGPKVVDAASDPVPKPEPSPDPTVTPTPPMPLRPALQTALAQQLLAMEPADDDDEWDRCPRCPERPGLIRKSRPKVNNGCGHLPIRRLGKVCQDCGEVVGPSPLAGKR